MVHSVLLLSLRAALWCSGSSSVDPNVPTAEIPSFQIPYQAALLISMESTKATSCSLIPTCILLLLSLGCWMPASSLLSYCQPDPLHLPFLCSLSLLQHTLHCAGYIDSGSPFSHVMPSQVVTLISDPNPVLAWKPLPVSTPPLGSVPGDSPCVLSAPSPAGHQAHPKSPHHNPDFLL